MGATPRRELAERKPGEFSATRGPAAPAPPRRCPACIRTWAARGYEGRSANYESLIDVLHRAGLAVLWVDNQSGCKGVCDRVPTASTTDLKDPALCVGESCYDGMMLKDLDTRIAALPAERRARGVVVVLHQIGSHGPAYYERSPQAFKRFLPECTSNALQNCSREELVNAYDNTIAYTDHFLASTVRWLKTRSDTASTAMVYVADHGESLGENNLYLHGMPYAMAPDVQKHVPWITWLSPGFAGSARTGAHRLPAPARWPGLARQLLPLGAGPAGPENQRLPAAHGRLRALRWRGQTGGCRKAVSVRPRLRLAPAWRPPTLHAPRRRS